MQEALQFQLTRLREARLSVGLKHHYPQMFQLTRLREARPLIIFILMDYAVVSTNAPA